MSEDLKDALLAIAAIAVPVLSAILDKNRKKRKTPQVHTRPVTDSEIEELRRTFDIEDDEEDPGHEIPIQEPVQPVKKEATVSAADIIAHTEETEEKKLSKLSPEDKKKLIIYSEIMKPKFDD